MQLDSNIWGEPSTYADIRGDGTFKRVAKTYPDILYDHPELRYPAYEKSSYRWGVPGDCSIGHVTSCMWWGENGEIKHTINEPILNTNVGLTFVCSVSNTTTSYCGMRNYAETYDRQLHLPPYQKENTALESYSGTVTWGIGAPNQTYSHRIKYTAYAGVQTPITVQCSKYNYNENVMLISGAFCCKQGNYVNSALSTSGSYELYNGHLKPLIEYMRTRYNADIAAGHNVEPADYVITGLSITPYFATSASESRITDSYSTIPLLFPTYQPSARWQHIYYQGDVDATTVYASNAGQSIGTGANSSTDDNISTISGLYRSSYNTLPTQTTFFNSSTNPYGDDNYRNMSACDAQLLCSSKKQVFGDVSYHWEWCIRGDYKSYELSKPLTLPTSAAAPFTRISLQPILVVDNYDTNAGDYFTAVYNACLHEVSFYGLPMATTYNDVRRAQWTVTQEKIYIPQFDNHMITTGRFTTLKESYKTDSAGQYTWGDVFASNSPVNDYEPDYQPKPAQSENDFGDLENSGGYRYFPSGHHIYKLNITELTQFMHVISSLYLTNEDGAARWNLDFKGTNPNDYIVSVYATLYDAPVRGTQEHLKINNLDLYDISSAYVADEIDITRSGKYDCGSIYIQPYYGDFRDYAPYTTAELYLPLCGTVDIDLTYFIGHYLNVVYWIDILTASCCAAIYRDGITLYKTVNGTIGAQIPVLSKNMGDYQNALHQLQQADKQNNIRLATSVLSTAVGTAAIIAAPESGGLSLAAGAGILAGIGGIASTALSKSDIKYQMQHKQPAVSQTGATSPQNDFCVGSITPKLWIKRAKMLTTYNADIYAHTVGNACCVNCKIGDVSGYTIASNIDMSGFDASAEEKSMLADILGKGVYL